MVNLYAERRQRGVSAAALADELGIRRESVGEIERALIEVSDEFAAKMVAAIERIAERKR